MRRFSQRSSLVTLSEINITPLLDLAFVLLIIFVITTPLLEQGVGVKLPSGGTPDRPIDKSDVRTVALDLEGRVYLNRTPMGLDQLEKTLVTDFRNNPNLVVYIRADGMSRVKELAAIMDRLQRNNITRYSLRTEPPKRGK